MHANRKTVSHRLYPLTFSLAALLWISTPASSQEAVHAGKSPARFTSMDSSHKSQPPEDLDMRRQVAQELKAEGVSVDWRKQDLLSLIDIQARVASAKHLKAMGVKADWSRYTSAALLDMEMRASIAQHLKAMGLRADWSKYNLQTLMDMETFAETAGRLKQNGVAVDKLKVGGAGNETAGLY